MSCKQDFMDEHKYCGRRNCPKARDNQDKQDSEVTDNIIIITEPPPKVVELIDLTLDPDEPEPGVETVIDLTNSPRSTGPCFKNPRFPGMYKSTGGLHEHQLQTVRRLLAPTCKGLILNFKVGSGKSLAAVAAAEALLDTGVINGVVYVASEVIQKEMHDALTKSQARTSAWKMTTPTKQTTDPLPTRGKLLVLDEAHNYRTDGAEANAMVKHALQATKVLLLTGTPLVNQPLDMRRLLQMTNPDVHTKARHFEMMQDPTNPKLWVYPSDSNTLRRAIQCTLLTHSPSKNNPAYPRKVRHIMEVNMTVAQCEAHWDLRNTVQRMSQAFDQASFKDVVAFLGGPRKICNEWKGCSPKFDAIVQHVKTGYRQGHKIIIYSSFVTVAGVDSLSERMKRSDIPHEVLAASGSHRKSVTARKELMRRYNDDSDPVKILLISDALSEGVTLKNTNAIHIAEPQFNRATIQQVMGRVIRQGSHTGIDKTVHVYQWRAKMIPGYVGEGEPWRKKSADDILASIMRKKERKNRAFMRKMIAWTNDAAETGMCNPAKWCET